MLRLAYPKHELLFFVVEVFSLSATGRVISVVSGRGRGKERSQESFVIALGYRVFTGGIAVWDYW